MKHAIIDRLFLSKIREVMGGNIRFMITGSAPAAPWLLEFFHSVGLPLLEAYGLSENIVPMAANRLESYRLGSVGKPLSANQILFAEDGEILVRGPGLFSEYYRNGRPEDRFTSDGFYRTGDYGYLDKEGFLFLTGRTSDIIKTSTGRRISPASIEGVYRQCPYLEEVVVFGNGRKYLVALVTLNLGAIEAEMKRCGMPPSRDELSQSPFVDKLIREEIDKYGRSLSPHEQVRAFAILPESLSMVKGELTTSLKPRRHVIEANHTHLIDRLYSPDQPLLQPSTSNPDLNARDVP